MVFFFKKEKSGITVRAKEALMQRREKRPHNGGLSPQMICSVVLFAVLFFIPALSSPSSCTEGKVQRIQKGYKDLHDITGDFVQKSYIKDLKQTETFQGRFFIKRPLKMKWEYSGEHAQEVFIRDEEILIYQKKEKQAFRGRFSSDTYGQVPIALLSGFGDIGNQFHISEREDRLVLKPKKSMRGIVSIEVVLTEEGFPIDSFTIYDSLANTIELKLRNVKVNSGIKDALFEPVLPKGIPLFESGL
jgi:outer membrane lipoprotein-sorting protein